MIGLGGTVLAAAAGDAMPSALLERVADDNSLIPGRLDRPCWRVMRPTMAPSVRALAAVSSRGVRELVAVNNGLCPRGGALLRPVTIPAGVSTARLVLEEVALPAGIGDTEPLTLELRDATGSIVVATVTYDPTATSTDVSTDAVAVTAGTEYLVRLACNETGQSRFVCGRIRLEPVEVTDTRWRRFRRIDVAEESIQDSVESGYRNPRYINQSQFAHVDLLTDADEIVVEAYDTVNDYLQNRGRFGVFVDGYPLAAVDTSYGRVNHEVIAIPAAGRRIKHVSAWAGPQASTGLTTPVVDNRGTFICAVYVPQSAYADVLPEATPAAGRTIVMLVDSKGSGYYSSNPGVDSLVPMLRRAGIRVVSVGAGGDALAFEIGSTVTLAACLPLARKLLRKRPDEIILQIGRNDFANSLMTGANLATQLGNLADAIHQIDGRVLVTFMTFTREVTETSKGGVTWDAERDAIKALVSTRSDWSRVLDAGEYWTSTDVASYVSSDTVHLNDEGQAKKARGIIAIDHPFSMLQLSNLFALHDVDYGLPGGAPGTVVATGSSPPTVTLSGTSSVTGVLVIEIKVAGQRGISKFRWGIDGFGWANGDLIPTAATVTLPIGITINFSTGTSYPNNAVYTAPLQISSLPDISGNGRHATALSTQYAMFEKTAMGGKPAALFDPTSPGDRYTVSGFTPLAAPYTVFAIAQIATAGTRGIVARTASDSGFLMHSRSDGAALTVTDGTSTVNATATMTNANLFIVRVNGASSSIRVNGTQTSVTLNNATLNGYTIGRDGVSSSFSFDKWIRRVGVCASAISDGECRALEALCRYEGFIS